MDDILHRATNIQHLTLSFGDFHHEPNLSSLLHNEMEERTFYSITSIKNLKKLSLDYSDYREPGEFQFDLKQRAERVVELDVRRPAIFDMGPILKLGSFELEFMTNVALYLNKLKIFN